MYKCLVRPVFGDRLENRKAGKRVDLRERFIKDENRTVPVDSSGDGNPLPMSGRNLYTTTEQFAKNGSVVDTEFFHPMVKTGNLKGLFVQPAVEIVLALGDSYVFADAEVIFNEIFERN